jgi:aminoglycoside 3-N-acetyltransferase
MIFLNSLKTHAKKHIMAYRSQISNIFRSFTPDQLQEKIDGLGVFPGDAVLVHSSFDAFEGFQGKPTDVISAVQRLVGRRGAVMMPTMTFTGTAVDYARTNPVFDVARTPSRMGLVTELFRRSPEVIRSIHPTHPVAIWGADAELIASAHHLSATPCGAGTPFEALLKRQGKIILLGVDFSVLTFYHLLEEFLEEKLPLKPFTDEVFHMQSKTRDGKVLDTHCRLFEPTVSRRRNLSKMIPFLQQSKAWHEARVGGLKVIVVSAVAVDHAVRTMNEQGIHCYD